MSFTALEYPQGMEEEDCDLAISLPGAQFTLWISPIFTHRVGPTEFATSGWEIIVIEDQRGQMVGHEYRDGSLLMWFGLDASCFYWPADDRRALRPLPPRRSQRAEGIECPGGEISAASKAAGSSCAKRTNSSPGTGRMWGRSRTEGRYDQRTHHQERRH